MILLLIKVQKYEKCSIEISFYTDPLENVLVSNKYHQFYHVLMMKG